MEYNAFDITKNFLLHRLQTVFEVDGLDDSQLQKVIDIFRDKLLMKTEWSELLDESIQDVLSRMREEKK